MSLMDEPPVSVSTTPLRTMRGAALATMCFTSSESRKTWVSGKGYDIVASDGSFSVARAGVHEVMHCAALLFRRSSCCMQYSRNQS